MDTHPAREPQVETQKSKRWYGIGAFAVLVVIGIVIVIFFSRNRTNRFNALLPRSPTPTFIPTPSPTPFPLICRGEYQFSVSGKGDQAPKIIAGILNPCDPKKGYMQFLTIQFDNSTPVVSGTVVVTTDTKSQTIDMKKLEDGTGWKASWRMDDTYDRVYTVAITGKTDVSEKTTTLTFR